MTGGQATAHGGWLVGFSSCAPGFGQSNPIIGNNRLPPLTESNFQASPLPHPWVFGCIDPAIIALEQVYFPFARV